MEYFGIIPGQSSRLSKVTKWLVAAVAVFMGYKGVQAGLWYYIPFALVLIVIAFFRKEQVLSDKGIDFAGSSSYIRPTASGPGQKSPGSWQTTKR